MYACAHLQEKKEMRVFVYKTVLVQSTDHDSVSLHLVSLETLQTMIVEVAHVKHSGWFCVYGTGLETIKTISSPDGTHFISADPDAEKRFPRALLEQSKPAIDTNRYWFRVDGLSASGRNYDFGSLSDHISLEVTEHLALKGIKPRLFFSYFAMPTLETMRSIHPVEVLQRIQPRFGICSVYTIDDNDDKKQWFKDLASKGFCKITSQQFAESFKSPEKAFVHKDMSSIMEYCIINSSVLTTGSQRFQVEFSSEVHAKECGRVDGTSLDSVLQSIKPLDLKIVFVKSPIFKPKKKKEMHQEVYFADDGTSRVLTAISPEHTSMSSTRLNPNWTFVPLYQDTARVEIDEAIPVALAMSQFASIPLNITLMDRLTSNKSMKMVEFWITRTMLQRGFDVLPYAKRHTLNDKKRSKKSDMGGSVKNPVAGVHFADETHVILMVDLQSFYSSIIAEKNMCITQSLAYLSESPSLASNILPAQKKIKKVDDHSVAMLEPFNKLTKAEKTKLRIQGKEIPSLKIKKLEARLAPIAEEAWRGINERRNAEDDVVKRALKKMLSCLYGVMLNSSMRYGVRQLGMAITSWGRFYINEIGNRLHTVLCDRVNEDRGVLLGITDSILLHATRRNEKEIEELIKHNLTLLQLTKLRVNAPEFFKAVYIQHKTGYAFLRENQKVVTVETVRALEPVQKKVPVSQKDIYINVMTTVLSGASVETIADLIGQIGSAAEEEGPMSDAYAVSRILIKRYMNLFPADVLKGEHMARLAQLTSVGTMGNAKSKVNSVKQQQNTQNRILISTQIDTSVSGTESNWWEPGALDTAIGFV